MMKLKHTQVDIAEFGIVSYIFLTMISDSTGDILTKIARIILVSLLGTLYLRRLRIPKISIPYIAWNLAFLLYCVFGCFRAFSQSYAINYTITLMYVISCNIFIVIYISLYIDKIDLVLKTMIAGALCKALLCYIQNGFLVFLNSRATDDISANTIGYYCAFTCVITWYYFRIEKRILYQVCAFLSLIFVILSGSRKALLFIIIPIAVMIVLKSKHPLKILKNIFIVCFGVFVIFFLIMNVNVLYLMVGNRIETAIAGIFGYGATDASTSTRLLLIYDGIEWFKQRPIWGYGLSNYRVLRLFYYPSRQEFYAHNNYVELLVDCGIVGTAIYYVLHLSILLKAIKKRRNMSDLSLMLLGMLISILVCDYAMVTYYSIFTHLILMLVYLIFFKETKQEYKLIS